MSTANVSDTCATPITKTKSSGCDSEQKQRLPVPLSVLTTDVQALEEFRAVRLRLTQLLMCAHSWANICWSATSVSSMSASSPCAGSMSMQGLQPAGSKLPQQTAQDTVDTLRCIQATLEDMQYVIATCHSEVRSAIHREASALASTAASCGISSTTSPYDVHRSSRDVLRAYESNIPVEVARGSAVLHDQSLPQVHEAHGLPTEEKNHAATTAALPSAVFAQPCPQQQQPSKMRWPAAQFCYVIHVEFKRGRVRRFFSRVSVTPASYALVPGDRGYDCGLVIQCALWNPHKRCFDVNTVQSLDPEVWPPGNHGTIMEVIRLATDDEVHRLHNEHVSMERLALNTCRDVADRLRLPMQVLDCEYQYDGTKITFFFDSTEMIDFRQLNKELYRTFNARIWMQNTNGAVRNTAPPSATSTQPWRNHNGHPCSDA